MWVETKAEYKKRKRNNMLFGVAVVVLVSFVAGAVVLL